MGRDNECRRIENVRLINLFEHIRQGMDVRSAIGDAYPIFADDYEERFTADELDDFVEFCGFGPEEKASETAAQGNVIRLVVDNAPVPR